MNTANECNEWRSIRLFTPSSFHHFETTRNRVRFLLMDDGGDEEKWEEGVSTENNNLCMFWEKLC